SRDTSPGRRPPGPRSGRCRSATRFRIRASPGARRHTLGACRPAWAPTPRRAHPGPERSESRSKPGTWPKTPRRRARASLARARGAPGGDGASLVHADAGYGQLLEQVGRGHRARRVLPGVGSELGMGERAPEVLAGLPDRVVEEHAAFADASVKLRGD